MRSVTFLVLLLVMTFTANASRAQSSLAVLGGDNEPISIDANDGIEWQRDAKLYIARGNATATRGDISLRADSLSARYRQGADGKNEIYRIDAVGGVVITSPTETAYGDKAYYSVEQRVMQLTGDDLRLITQTDLLTARDSLEYWENYEGRAMAVARGDAQAERPAEGQRILSDVMTATFAKNPQSGKSEIERIDAFGDVRLSTNEEFARGDKGVYYVQERRAILDGNVRITSGENQLNGERAEIDLETGVSRLLAREGGRVEGLLKSDGSAGQQSE